MKQPKYWVGHEDLNGNQEEKKLALDEFGGDLRIDETLSQATEENLEFSTNRRDFLKLFGFGITAATLTACNKTPLKKVIPYVVKPDDIIPGVANYYSSICGGCSAGCGVVVKTREGRPIRVDGNPDSRIANGGLCAVGMSTVLSLYDVDRLQTPTEGGNETSWEAVDATISQQLSGMNSVRLVSGTISSPSTLAIINDFLAQFGDGQHIMYDTESAFAIALANEQMFGQKVLPAYKFDKAEVIAGFNCDFLGTWLSPVEFAHQYAKMRDPKAPKMSRHFQVESLLTTTGSKADLRLPIKPSQEGLALLNLYNKVASRTANPRLNAPDFNVAANFLDKLADELVAARGKSLVVSGTNDANIQLVVNGINAMLDNHGTTVDIANPSHIRKGDDVALAAFVRELESGSVDTVIFYDANPVYNTAYGEAIASALPNVKLSVSFAGKADETSELCQFTCPDHHYLESWNDGNPQAGHYTLAQPTINPIFRTRQAQESLMTWTGAPGKMYDYLKTKWESEMMGMQSEYADFQQFWDETLRKGSMDVPAGEGAALSADSAPLTDAASKLVATANSSGDGMELMMYSKVSMRDGTHANNPWLQELPDPITRVCWDNYVMVPYAYGEENNLEDGDLVKVEVNGKSVELPILRQFGQAAGTLGIALGYGRETAGKTADQTGGKSVFPMLGYEGETVRYARSGASIAAGGGTYPLAKFQKYNLLVDPEKIPIYGHNFDRTEHIIHEETLEFYKSDEWQEKVAAANEHRKHLYTLWDSHYEDPESKRAIHWVMAIDLNKCTGCAACIVSCHAENNVPVVGKQEIMTHRDMHWLRLDRYYKGDPSGNPENVDVVFQPLMCQHCDNAPCETVCPVLATIHSKEGLNQMAYNRCVGTRYCANNCPYKVRRFNWFLYHSNDKFDYHLNNDLGKMVLNPDVTVRYRGVMEKCSFCVQRLQEGKLKAKLKSNSTFAKPKDGEIQTACQQACPTGAIVFGDLNDPASEVSQLFRDDRSYKVIEEVKTLPSVSYMTMIRNRKEGEGPMQAETTEENTHA